jgi:hypothetical protein
VNPLGEVPTPHDLEVVSEQLGREARDIVGVSSRCVCGNPVVVVTKPRLGDGTPFPTLYYMTQPEATKAASRLEAAGRMVAYQEKLAEDEAALLSYRAAHDSYLETRASIEVVEEIEGISAGGMPDRVKCLHSLMGHALSVGPGVNLVGDWALAETQWGLDPCHC